ncbi:CD276 antigen homolog [Rhinoderma darwinii]|uniref:CD276 antigen homolog n=1 Tax=Rhinoderma darwinii TaxID=43563 RepID=UPI003F67B8B0
MAFLGLLLCLLLHQTFAELEVFAPSPQRVLNGFTVVLPCTFSVHKLHFDPKYLAILWSFQGRQILVYDNKGITKDPRVTFDVEATKNGNASLAVANVTLSDGGTYSCLVVYSPERIEKDIILEVQVRPVIIFPNQTVRKERENTLLCVAVGFFPQDIKITWTLDGKIQNNSIIQEPVKNKDGTCNVTSSVTFTMRPPLEAKTLSCRVHHTSLHEPLQEDLKLIYEEETPSEIIVACCVLVLMLIIIIAGVLWWKRKRGRKDKGPFTVRDIEGPPKLIDGEEATLYYTVDTCPENLCVTWLIRSAGQVQEIQTSQMRGHSEEGESLLDKSYVIKSQREGHQNLSSLRFIPHMERHKDVTFLCRGVSSQHNDEKTFHCKTIYGEIFLLYDMMDNVIMLLFLTIVSL